MVKINFDCIRSYFRTPQWFQKQLKLQHLRGEDIEQRLMIFSTGKKVFNVSADKIGNSTPTEYFAAEVTLTGNVTGKFYVKCSNNGTEVAAYDYKNADLTVEVDSDTLESIIAGNIAPREAVISGKLEMIGRASIMAAFTGLIS